MVRHRWWKQANVHSPVNCLNQLSHDGDDQCSKETVVKGVVELLPAEMLSSTRKWVVTGPGKAA